MVLAAASAGAEAREQGLTFVHFYDQRVHLLRYRLGGFIVAYIRPLLQSTCAPSEVHAGCFQWFSDQKRRRLS
jgi:hypothetical protein